MEKGSSSPPSNASLRWAILRQAFLSPPPLPSNTDEPSQIDALERISRKSGGGFNLIPHRLLNGHFSERSSGDESRDVFVQYSLPVGRALDLTLIQRIDNCIDLNDFEISSRYDIDSTGLVCCWPSEDVLAYFCLTNSELFRGKRVLELGSGYGLAGLAIAACTDAQKVVISDGNPEVINYVQRSIDFNAGVFRETEVKSMSLHWNQEQPSDVQNTFDIIVASDCTFFKKFHKRLALTVKSLLKYSETSEAIFLSPRRGDSLEKFIKEIEANNLHLSVIENYNVDIWNLHLKFLNGGDTSWPNYDMDHCYPLLVKISF
ncbi:hypothetical protein QJS10_CPA01g00406 [Acorus calamus]|uniref:Calmodulin-lysine N-methyltransferase n=1 Tax=Acorus calamus TaxID=4465 RepID=A0AAV9FIA1_ACOCL|nr:hypothetical protein QJS10_CPA01g00406 [Acorus calamus]